MIKFGKPTKPTFDFAKSRLYAQASAMGVEISNFYMIGDNPHADIKGGNDNDCDSILVRTGVFSGLDPNGNPLANDPQNPAKYVVEDMQEAYSLILEKEGLKDVIIFQ